MSEYRFQVTHTTSRPFLWAWLGLLVCGVALAAWFYRDELIHIIRVVTRASPAGTALAILCEMAFLAVYWDLVARLYRAAGTPVPRLALLRLLMIAGVVDRLLPTAGTSGIAVLALSGARWGITWASTLWMTALLTALGLVATALIVAVSVILLSLWDIALPPSIHRSLVIGRWAAVAGLLLGLGFFWPPLRQRVVRHVIRRIGTGVRWWNRHRPRWWKPGLHRGSEWNEEERFQAFEATWARIRRQPALWIIALAENLSLYGFRIGTLAAFLSALHITLPWHHLIAGYGLVVLLVNLSALPFSLGIFEVSMAALYHWLGVPWDQAWALTLAYRGITFWLPIPLGLLAMIPGREQASPPRPREG
ncbi:MAG: flippase-like domain-containing protein [Alicyclobacillaceae bacterium]|nr:flippase-like domain-containing protein [Alicyclobacillaceae bacterium]